MFACLLGCFVAISPALLELLTLHGIIGVTGALLEGHVVYTVLHNQVFKPIILLFSSLGALDVISTML